GHRAGIDERRGRSGESGHGAAAGGGGVKRVTLTGQPQKRAPVAAFFSFSTSACYLPYTGNFAHRAFTFSRTASITASLFTSARMSQIQPASSRHSISFRPRVVTAG